jgi:NAD(P)-dependent dehydrogenase (short-subunit alcohol dehydrogenase family)
MYDPVSPTTTSSIGRAIALQLARDGAEVMLRRNARSVSVRGAAGR